jgi:hypothetical protein
VGGRGRRAGWVVLRHTSRSGTRGGSVGDDESAGVRRVRQTVHREPDRSSAPTPPPPPPPPPPPSPNRTIPSNLTGLSIYQSPRGRTPHAGIFLFVIKSEEHRGEHRRGAAEPPAARTVPVFIQASLSILMEGMPRGSSTARSNVCGGKLICKRRRPKSQFLNLPEVC